MRPNERVVIYIRYLFESKHFYLPKLKMSDSTIPSGNIVEASQPIDVKEKLSSTEAAPTATRLFSRKEVAEHNNSNDIWLIMDDHVYDVTKFINEVKLWKDMQFF